MIDLLSGLNPIQQEIVKDTEGQLLVLAGAGSGKTRVLTHRIAYLLEQGIKPWHILAVTFTNKAAREMRERIVDLSGVGARDVWMGTFHGTCLRILSRFGGEIGYDKFTIIDDKDQQKMMKEILAICEIDMKHKSVLSVISNKKNDLQTPDDVQSAAVSQFDKDIANAYIVYEERKKEHNYLDFDDLIMKTVQLFDVSEEARATYQEQFRYILTDETQDTNKAQFRLLTTLCEKHGNLFAVGDSDQSIYKWRGAEISNIINFEQYFPEVKVYRLEQNYRSTQTIVEASNALIVNNEERLDKNAFTQNDAGDNIVICKATEESRESDFIVSIIERAVNLQNRKYSDFAILYRTNSQSRSIEASINQRRIPYQIIGGHAFYDRKEIRDMIAYLRALNNGVDALAFERIINVPRRGIGDTTVSRIQDYANDCSIAFPTALEHLDDIPKITARTKGKIIGFLELMERLKEYALSDGMQVAELIRMILRETQYFADLNPDKEEDAARIENIQELIKVAHEWDEEAEEGKGLDDFLAETSLVSDADSLEADNKVSLMTVHSSKGLEFPIVFVAGMEEQVFPHSRSIGNPAEMEEERRLAYVAMTRAEEKLFLTHCGERYYYAGRERRKTQCVPSRFLEELPKNLIREIQY